eukprot:1482512-Pyramimonas_sp.AAC.1
MLQDKVKVPWYAMLLSYHVARKSQRAVLCDAIKLPCCETTSKYHDMRCRHATMSQDSINVP